MYRNGRPKNLSEGKGRSNLNLALYGCNFERQRKAAGRATRLPVDNLEDGDKEGERCQVLGIFHDLRRALDYICGEPRGVIMYCENQELLSHLATSGVQKKPRVQEMNGGKQRFTLLSWLSGPRSLIIDPDKLLLPTLYGYSKFVNFFKFKPYFVCMNLYLKCLLFKIDILGVIDNICLNGRHFETEYSNLPVFIQMLYFSTFTYV